MSVSIRSHQEIINLTQHLQYPNGVLYVKLERLGSLHTAGTSYHALVGLIHPRPVCKHLDTLENYCAFYTDLDHIELVLLPAAQNAQVLNNASSLALAAIKSKAHAMNESGKCYLKGIRRNSEIYTSAREFGDTLFGIVDDVLRGATPFNVFLGSIPNLIVRIQALKNIDMEFSG
jgi:hypothetical protein